MKLVSTTTNPKTKKQIKFLIMIHEVRANKAAANRYKTQSRAVKSIHPVAEQHPMSAVEHQNKNISFFQQPKKCVST
jgi:hypothetical protein